MVDDYSLYRYGILNALAVLGAPAPQSQRLSESYINASQSYGKQVQDILNSLIDAVYQAPEDPDIGTVSILAHHQETLNNLKKVREAMAASYHKKPLSWLLNS